MSKPLVHLAAPKRVAISDLTIADIIHTAWYRGNEQRRWEAAEGLVDEAEQLMIKRVIAMLDAENEKMTTFGLLSPETAPRDGREIDIWVQPKSYGDREPPIERYPGVSWVHIRYEEGKSIDGWRYRTHGTPYDITDPVVGWAPIPDPKRLDFNKSSDTTSA
jgi:hypothetical protein